MNPMKEGEKIMGTRRPGWKRKEGLDPSCGFSAWSGGHYLFLGSYMVPLFVRGKCPPLQVEAWLGQKTVFMHKTGVPSSEENSPGLWCMARFLPHWELCAVPNLHNCTCGLV